MGRLQYVARLALGRSAFEVSDEEAEHAQDADSPSDEAGAQRYDSRGRPMNARTEKFNADLRKAQNDVLAVVGVVERKKGLTESEKIQRRVLNDNRRDILVEEQETGEMLEFALLPYSHLLGFWSSTLIKRIQIGFYQSAQSMTEILSHESTQFTSGGLRKCLARLFPAMCDYLLLLARLPLVLVAEQIAGRLHHRAGLSISNRKAASRLQTSMKVFFGVLLCGIDVALLPVKLHSYAQCLGLAPALPLFPSLTAFLPWHASSYHHFAWRPLLPIPVIGRLTSPGALLLIERILKHDSGDGPYNQESPRILGVFTDYKYNPINPSSMGYMCSDVPESFQHDPIGSILHRAYNLRLRFLKWCGWRIENQVPSKHMEEDAALQGNALIDEDGRHPGSLPPGWDLDEDGDPPEPPVYRATALAHLPANTLAGCVDDTLARLLMLPFDSLMLRAIATSYMAFPSTTKTPAAMAASTNFYAPFGGGPLNQMIRSTVNHTAWLSAAHYISRIGLAFALHSLVDAALFFGTYGITRYIGNTHLEWGRGKSFDPNLAGTERQQTSAEARNLDRIPNYVPIPRPSA